MTMKRTLTTLAFVLAFGTVSFAAEGDFRKVVQPFLQKHCYSCHGPEKQQAGIRYDRISDFRSEDRHLWTLVHEKVSTGEMPPVTRKQPGVDEKRTVLSWIAKEQPALRIGITRRLNRRELNAALQDVTGLSIDFSLSLPADGKVAGFDTGIAGLQDTADSVNQALEVTRRAVHGLRLLEKSESKTLVGDLKNLKDTRRGFDPWKEAGAYAKIRGTHRQGEGLFIDPKWLGERGGLTFAVPPTENKRGVLRVKVVVHAAKGDFAGIPNPHLWMEVGNKVLDYREITATKDNPLELTYEVQIEDAVVGKRGIEVELHNKVEIPYGVKGFDNEDRSKPQDKIPGGTGFFRPAYDRKQKGPPESKPIPYVVLQRIEIDPDYKAPWPPAEWKADVGEIGDNPESAKKLLELWLHRAWRRPASKSEQERFLTFYRSLRKKGMSFEDALRATFQSVLLSAPFRYLSSPRDKELDHAQSAIASRLSFMLTGSPPDQQLRQLAKAGKLRQSEILNEQVDRLLRDPRSQAFFDPFVTQWLEIGQPITLVMDNIRKQDFRFGRFLKESMRAETVAYLSELFHENGKASELIQSDWTMMNNSLAQHYGYQDVNGSHLRKVKLRNDDPRGGGILGQSGIQSMLCWMGDNWVIYRGAWTLRHVLDDPPLPPPLEVPELNPSDNQNRGKSFKELLVQHQKDNRCAMCHRTMDPLGFAFQNFDLSGRWRDVEHERYQRAELDGKIEWNGAGKTRPVDTIGKLPRGEEFKSFSECKQKIVQNYQEDLVRGVMKNLVIYGTGRRPDIADLAEIRKIMKEQKANGYPLRDLLKALIRSPVFLDH